MSEIKVLADKKNIWIINEYAGSPHYGTVFRHYYLAKNWIKMGYNVTIVSATYSHLFKKYPSSKKQYNFEDIEGINYLWLKVPKYKESKDIWRIIKWFVFSLKLYFLPVKKMSKPDVIVYSGTAPFSIYPSIYLKKKLKAKLIFEVRDIWPLSIIELGGVSPKHPLVKLMQAAEKTAITKSDHVVSNLQNYPKHMEALGLQNEFSWISNGVELEELMNAEALNEKSLNQVPKNKFIVGYTGTIGIANELATLCKAAELLKYNQDILFVLVGNGRNKENLINKYGHLENLLFLDAIPKVEVPNMLALFDVCYLGWHKKEIYKYGTSANKIFDYMFSGVPILNAFSGGGDVVQIANCGVSVEAMDAEAVKKGILELYNMEEQQRNKLGQNGKEYVLEHFTYQALAQKYTQLF